MGDPCPRQPHRQLHPQRREAVRGAVRSWRVAAASYQLLRNPILDRTMFWRPAEQFGCGFAADPAVGAEREYRLLASPGGDRLLGRPGLRGAETKARRDGPRHLAQ